MKIGEIIKNRYEVLALIGQGGLSKVYLALDKKTNIQYAIKVIDKSKEMHYISIKKEAELLSKLHHTSIPNIIDIMDFESEIIIVMDLIDGKTVEKILNESVVSIYEARQMAAQLIDVFKYLHSHNIIYRDLKPANIIVKPYFQIVLVDFGIARTYVPGKLDDTMHLGTRGYAAPEQYGGMGQTDKRTDIYAFGVTMFHILTGISPNDLNCTQFSVKKFIPDISESWEYIIKKCTQLDPNSRYQSFEEIEGDFFNFKTNKIRINAINVLKKLNKKIHSKKQPTNNIIQVNHNIVSKNNPNYFKGNTIPRYHNTYETTLLIEDSGDYQVPTPVFEINKTQVFLSYCNSDSDLADIICKKLECYDYIEISRYTTSVPYKGSFREFMNSLGDHDKVIMIISDQYLKSRACMYEVGQLIKSDDFKNKILFIVCSDRDKQFYKNELKENIEAKIYDPHDRNQYIIYWERKLEELQADLDLIKNASAKLETIEIIRDIEKIIREDIGRFMKYLSDANGISFSDLYMHDFSEFIDDLKLV